MYLGVLFALIHKTISMRLLYFTILTSILSCSQSAEERCFVEKLDTNNDIIILKDEPRSYTLDQILDKKPGYLEIINLTKYRDFTTDRTEESRAVKKDEITTGAFSLLDHYFYDQFIIIAQQKSGNTLYGLALNKLGYWLLKVENDQPFAYFLGLSPDQYYFNKTQQNPIIQGGFLQIEGSLVKTSSSDRREAPREYSVLDVGKLFRIKLKDLLLDSDHDGYNDIFENSFGLNPHQKDTDGDGINDFEDRNPMFKSSDNKFTRLYEALLPSFSIDPDKLRYFFQVYKSDCDYFHQVNPTQKVLFIPVDQNKQTDYARVSDITDETISPIQKNKKDPDSFYIYKVGSFYKNEYAAEYKNGKWTLKVVGGYII